MSRRQRSNTVLGILLILAGAAFLAQQFYPNLRIWSYFTFSWPWYMIGAGALLLLLGLLAGAPGMAIPATIVAGIAMPGAPANSPSKSSKAPAPIIYQGQENVK
jgi:hypothetical protein